MIPAVPPGLFTPATEPLHAGSVAGADSTATCRCSCHHSILTPLSTLSTVWYAITKGCRVGVYSSRAVVQDVVSGCRAAYCKFSSCNEAESYFNEALANQVVSVI
ncbi:hypothetical protein BT96DRAFT_996221 [Gymnopus androsaceus JB14]|uniref:Ribonuclease H1 N-terminal domain-containing protein n=1 Tax=Gymnopus androsaceus JB14 TaxID=1447944 RepID=A0A6A4HGA5_9AGAR|nr:hypothetical protein BT96DRAFT_996221 [Gymnopus androsaceus JB14]